MRMTHFVVVAGLTGALGLAASADPPGLQIAPIGAKVEPLRLARANLVDGQIRLVGDWIEYNRFKERAVTDDCLFDGFGREYGPAATGVPDDFGWCASPFPGVRWYFGETFLNPFAEGDMLGHRSGEVTEVDFAWFWYAGGVGTREQCYVAAFATNGNAAECWLATTGTGFVIDFGVLESGSGIGYYYANVDLTGLGMALSRETGDQVVLLQEFGSGVTLCTCCQMMLWGSPNNTGTGYVPFPTAIGAQEDGELDDIAPTDAVLDPETECYSSAYGICPDPLQFMLAWGGRSCLADSLCPADFDGNGFLTGDDFDEYVTKYLNGSGLADVDCDGFVTGDDFEAYVAAFEAGC